MICQREDVKISQEAILSLIRVSEGDLRKAIMYLQSASRLIGKDAEIQEDVIADIAGVRGTVTLPVANWIVNRIPSSGTVDRVLLHFVTHILLSLFSLSR